MLGFWKFAAASMPPEASVLRALRALGARRDSFCAMPPRRVAGDERSEPPVASGRGCGGCAVGIVVSWLRDWWVCWMFAAASMPPEASVLRELRALDARRDSGCAMPPRPGLRDAAASGGWGRAKRAPSGVRARMRRLC